MQNMNVCMHMYVCMHLCMYACMSVCGSDHVAALGNIQIHIHDGVSVGVFLRPAQPHEVRVVNPNLQMELAYIINTYIHTFKNIATETSKYIRHQYHPSTYIHINT